jgi:hypothetical protein
VTPAASVAIDVTFRASPPPAAITHTCELPSRFDTKASHLPSGDHLGRSSDRSVATNFTGSPPEAGTT